MAGANEPAEKAGPLVLVAGIGVEGGAGVGVPGEGFEMGEEFIAPRGEGTVVGGAAHGRLSQRERRGGAEAVRGRLGIRGRAPRDREDNGDVAFAFGLLPLGEREFAGFQNEGQAVVAAADHRGAKNEGEGEGFHAMPSFLRSEPVRLSQPFKYFADFGRAAASRR